MWVTEAPRKLTAGEWVLGGVMVGLGLAGLAGTTLTFSHFLHEHLQLPFIPDLAPHPEGVPEAHADAQNILLFLISAPIFMGSLIVIDDLRRTRKGLPIWMPYGQ